MSPAAETRCQTGIDRLALFVAAIVVVAVIFCVITGAAGLGSAVSGRHWSHECLSLSRRANTDYR